MQKVIILGSNGMLGQALLASFSENGKYEVIGWDIADIDISDQKSVDMAMLKEMPDIIINAAAFNDVDGVEDDDALYEKAKEVNGYGPKYLAKAAKKRDAIFVQYVTDYVFDGNKDSYLEDDITNPISRYGKTKEMGEKNVQSVGGRYYLIRISKLFGDPGKSENTKKSFFDVMLSVAKNKKSVKVVDGEKSCFTYAPDLAKATKQLIEENHTFGIYHIVNEGPVTWFEAAKKLFKIAGEKISVIPVGSGEFPRKAARPHSSVLLNTKFHKLRNYEDALNEWLNNKKNT